MKMKRSKRLEVPALRQPNSIGGRHCLAVNTAWLIYSSRLPRAPNCGPHKKGALIDDRGIGIAALGHAVMGKKTHQSTRAKIARFYGVPYVDYLCLEPKHFRRAFRRNWWQYVDPVKGITWRGIIYCKFRRFIRPVKKAAPVPCIEIVYNLRRDQNHEEASTE